MSESLRTPLFLVIALACGAGGYFWLRPGPGAAPESAPSAPEGAAPAVSPPAPATADPKPASPVGPPPAPNTSKGKAVYPDGSEHPALNGVEEKIQVAWPKQVPFSPVVGEFVDRDGLAWYRHADGSQSTTKIAWRKDLGRNAPITLVANPTKATPVLMEEPGGKTRLIPGPGDDKKN